jgi:hypothetical protein
MRLNATSAWLIAICLAGLNATAVGQQENGKAPDTIAQTTPAKVFIYQQGNRSYPLRVSEKLDFSLPPNSYAVLELPPRRHAFCAQAMGKIREYIGNIEREQTRLMWFCHNLTLEAGKTVYLELKTPNAFSRSSGIGPKQVVVPEEEAIVALRTLSQIKTRGRVLFEPDAVRLPTDAGTAIVHFYRDGRYERIFRFGRHVQVFMPPKHRLKLRLPAGEQAFCELYTEGQQYDCKMLLLQPGREYIVTHVSTHNPRPITHPTRSSFLIENPSRMSHIGGLPVAPPTHYMAPEGWILQP